MKPLILTAATIFTIGFINTTTALAQPQRLTCVRERNIITCPNYGSFQYKSNGKSRNRKAINISCFRDRNVINCPNYGSFVYKSDNNINSDQEINNIYLQVLGRNANANELNRYRKSINNQALSLEQLRGNLANSEEFSQVLNRIYRQYLGRDSNIQELRSCQNIIINGGSLESVRDEIANSPEANSRNNDSYNPYGNINWQKEINDLYIHVLGRNATGNELNKYAQTFNNQTNYLADARRDLVNSQEFSRAINNFYRTYLGRNADNNGLQSYRNAVMSGMSLEDVRNEIANSPEARNRNYNYYNNDNQFDSQSTTSDFLQNILCELTGLCF